LSSIDTNPISNAGAFRVASLPHSGNKETMSTKIDFIVYVKGKLNHEFAKLTTANDVQGAQNVQRFLGVPDQIHNGYFARIEPFF
jgi:hypothetical protein